MTNTSLTDRIHTSGRLLRSLITISVVSHGHGPLLHALLTDLSRLPQLSGVHVVVTLNLAGDQIDAQSYAALRFTVLNNARPRGFGANHNEAFRHCQTPWLVILNPDLRVSDPQCFEKILDAAIDIPSVGLLAPTVLGPSGKIEDSVRSNLSLHALVRRWLVTAAPPPANSDHIARPGGRFFWLAGMFMVANASVFRRIGGFDERFFLYCEDYDLCARMYNAGHAIALVREATIIHDARRDSRRSAHHLLLHLSSLAKVWLSSAFWRVWRSQRSVLQACPSQKFQ